MNNPECEHYPHVVIDVQPSEATPETLEPHPRSTIDDRNLWKKNKQLSIPPMLEENATVSRPGDLELVKNKIGQENHAAMDTSEAGPSFGGEGGSPKLKENSEIGPAPEPMDPSEAEPSRSEPRSRSKLKEPVQIGSTSNFSEESQPETWKIKLYRLVASRDTESFNRLNRPITIPQLSWQDNSALHLAAQYKQAEMAAAIIQREPELVNFRNMNGDLPLHIAARVGCVDTSSVLIQQMKHYDMITYDQGDTATNDQGDTALHDAVRGAHLKVVELLVDFNPSWTSTENNVGESPLFLAVDKWHFKIADAIFSKYECSIRGRDSMNVLHAAIIRLGQGHQFSRFRTIKAILYAVLIDPILSSVDLPLIPLIRYTPKSTIDSKHHTKNFKAESGKQNVVDYLLEAQGFEGFINKKDNDGNTPLHLASIQGNHGILVKLADDDRVDGSAMNNKGLTAVDIVQSSSKFTNSEKAYISFRLNNKFGLLTLKKEVRQMKESEDKPVKEKDQAPKEEADSQSNANDMYKDDMFVVVATLIASVTFGAALQIPGGYKGDDPGRGSAIMIKHLMFNIFVLADCFSFALSSGSIFVHFWASIEKSSTVAKKFRRDARILTNLSIGGMVVAFTAGIHVALGPSRMLWAASTGLCIFFLWGPMLIFNRIATMIYKKAKDKWHIARERYSM